MRTLLTKWTPAFTGNLLFFAACMLVAAPVLSMTFLHTLDGPAHLYNADAIRQLLSGNKGLLQRYYGFTPAPVPNWSVHVLMGLLSAFLSVPATLKAVHLLYVFTLAYGFRRLVRTLVPQQEWLSFVIFPLLFTYPFFLGFFNFMFSLAILFFLFSEWIRRRGQLRMKRDLPVFAGGLLLSWFTHFMGFGLLILFIGLYEVAQLFSPGTIREKMTAWKPRLFVLLPALLLPALFTVLFLRFRTLYYPPVHLAASELHRYLFSFDLVTTYTTDAAGHTAFLQLLYVLLPLSALAYFFFEKYVQRTSSPRHTPLVVFSLLLLLVLLLAYYTLPDSDGSGALITMRFAWLLYLLLPLFAAALRLPSVAGYTVALLLVFEAWKMNAERSGNYSYNNRVATACWHCANDIRPHSLFESFTFSRDWMWYHAGDLAITGKDVVLCNNYETSVDYFPLKWKQQTSPPFRIDGRCADDFGFERWNCATDTSSPPPDYILIVGKPEDTFHPAAAQQLEEAVKKEYRLVHEEFVVRLYARR